jgi:hypothetical protein
MTQIISTTAAGPALLLSGLIFGNESAVPERVGLEERVPRLEREQEGEVVGELDRPVRQAVATALSVAHSRYEEASTNLAMIIVSSSCLVNFAVSLLLTKRFSSSCVSLLGASSLPSTDKLWTTRRRRRIFEVGAEGSSAAGRALAMDAGEGASYAASVPVSVLPVGATPKTYWPVPNPQLCGI